MIGDREIMIKEKIVSPFVKTLVNSNALDKIEDNMMPLKRLIHDAVFAGERLKIIFVGAELFGPGHLGLLGDAHLGEKHLAQLTRGIDVQIGFARLGADRCFQFAQLAVQLDGIDGQRPGVDPHARHLDVG